MGYTHYWYTQKELDSNKWNEFTKDVKQIIASAESAGIAHGDGCGENEPVIDDDAVIFNGSESQPIGQFTTSDHVGLLWPADDTTGEPIPDPIAPRFSGTWFAGQLAIQRIAPINEKTGFGSGSYETVHIARTHEGEPIEDDNRGLNGYYFDCCKTNYRPYDLTLTAVLVALKHHFGNKVYLVTDGESKDWIDGRLLCYSLLGYGMDIELFEKPEVLQYKKPAKVYPPHKDTKDIAVEVKQVMKAKGVKVSARSDFNTIDISIMEGAEPIQVEQKNYNINQYHYKDDENLTEYGKKIVGDILEIILKYYWNDSDSMTDYFSSAFYYHITAGKWDKPYKVIQAPAKAAPVTLTPLPPAPVERNSIIEAPAAGVKVVEYSPKSFAVIGEGTKAIKDTLSELGGTFNRFLKCGPGWIFSNKRRESVNRTLSL